MEVNKAMNNIIWRYWQRKLFIIEERAVLSIDGKVSAGGIYCPLVVSQVCPTMGSCLEMKRRLLFCGR